MRLATTNRGQMGGGVSTPGGRGRSAPETPGRLGGAATTGSGQMGGAASTGGRRSGGAGTPGPAGLPTVSGDQGGRGASAGRQTGGAAFGTRPSNWNQYPRKFDRHFYERNIHASRHYHWRSYHRPYGWYYRRWVFGQIFPSIFWARDYWLIDYWMFDLPIPPYGYVWVRYGDDALLIDRQTGQILQVVYDIFE